MEQTPLKLQEEVEEQAAILPQIAPPSELAAANLSDLSTQADSMCTIGNSTKVSFAQKEVSTASKSDLSAKQRRRARRDTWFVAGQNWLDPVFMFGNLIAMLICALIPFLGKLHNQLHNQLSFLTIGFVGCGCALQIAMWRRMRIARREATSSDINILLHGTGNLLKFIGNKPKWDYLQYRAARNALLELLPVLRATDGDLISAQSHLTLNKCSASNDKALVMAVLDALPHIGTQIALSHVEALANEQLKLGKDIEVREMAMVCLPLLKYRIAEQNKNTLLRASHPLPSGEELLRPAENTLETAPEQLLRAVQNNDIEQL